MLLKRSLIHKKWRLSSMINELVARYKTEERWDQRAILIRIIHNGMISDNKGWRIRDSAALLGISMGLCSESILMAENMDQLKDAHSHRQALAKLKAEGKIKHGYGKDT